ncbi:MAG: protein phosphatase 2C domain-containing protein [Planctomycetes bacterium]|nr:protein phosphatase 2C domain-containing protein [Planctomycetota bacterium]
MPPSPEADLRKVTLAMRRLAVDLVGASHAADVVQDTWLQALSLDRRKPRSLKGYLFTALKGLASKHRRAERRRLRREQSAAREDYQPPADLEAQLNETLHRLNQALLSLPEPDTWAVAAAALRGASHIHMDLPCQDAVAVRRDHRGHVCAVVCDGAGSASLSEHGAAAVSQSMASFLLHHATQMLESRLPPEDIIAVACSAITSVQQERGGSLDDYACTLVALVLADNHVATVHVGDGLIVHLGTGSGEVLSAPENGSSKCTTFFVTCKDAASHTRSALHPLDATTTGLAVMSDGSADVLYDRASKRVSAAVDQMAGWLSAQSEEDVEEVLRETITEHFLSRTHDDCSLILLRRLPSEPWACPVCGRLDLLQEPQHCGKSFLRCPACGFSHFDRKLRGKRYPFLLQQWIRFLHREEHMSLPQLARLTRVPQPTIARWLLADARRIGA